jgi:HEPN domain-containing protein
MQSGQLQKSGGSMLDAAVFYSQQATGKALKAMYISEFSKLLRTYDLVKLAHTSSRPTMPFRSNLVT